MAGDPLTAYFEWYASEYDRARASIAPADLRFLYDELERVRRNGRQLFVLGNGGSAASASHWACDFGKGVSVTGQRRLRVQSPGDQLAWHTALANDIAYADALAEQLENWIADDDLVVALSVSGDSENLVRAATRAQGAGARVVAVVGAARGRLAALADRSIVLESRDYGVVEDLHMTINHVLSQFMRGQLRAASGV